MRTLYFNWPHNASATCGQIRQVLSFEKHKEVIYEYSRLSAELQRLKCFHTDISVNAIHYSRPHRLYKFILFMIFTTPLPRHIRYARALYCCFIYGARIFAIMPAYAQPRRVLIFAKRLRR